MRDNQPVSETHPHWSKAAVACIILGVLGFATLWLVVGLFLAAIGALCGHMAGYHISQAPRKTKGRGLASFGLVVCYFTMFLFPVLAIGVGTAFPMFQKHQLSKFENLQEESRFKAEKLFLACENYARSNNDSYPETWDALAGKFMTRAELNGVLRSPYPNGEVVAFEIVSHERPVLNGIAGSVVVIQELAPPSVKRIAIVTADGNVSLILNPNRP